MTGSVAWSRRQGVGLITVRTCRTWVPVCRPVGLHLGDFVPQGSCLWLEVGEGVRFQSPEARDAAEPYHAQHTPQQ